MSNPTLVKHKPQRLGTWLSERDGLLLDSYAARVHLDPGSIAGLVVARCTARSRIAAGESDHSSDGRGISRKRVSASRLAPENEQAFRDLAASKGISCEGALRAAILEELTERRLERLMLESI